MAFLLILDREHKVLWVKTKNRSTDSNWVLPEVEDPVNKPTNRLNVELLAKQAFIPLKSNLIGKKVIFDIFRNERQLYLFLCPGKESSEVLFDLTKYRNIQWMPINCIERGEDFSALNGKTIVEAYHEIFLTEIINGDHRFHIIKNGHGKKDIEDYNQTVLTGNPRLFIELLEQYNHCHQSLPAAGDYALLNNWKGLPVAILEITEVYQEPFEKIESFIKNNEGQDEVEIKRIVGQYKKNFSRWYKKNNKQFSDNKPVVISQFKIIKTCHGLCIDHIDCS